jgi:putative oxidoreductase
MENQKSNRWYTGARILLGVILLPNAIAPFFVEPEALGMPLKALETFKFFWSTGYLMYLVKLIELITAISLLSNRFVKLTTVLFAPIAVNIVLFHVFLAPSGLIIGLITFLLTASIAYKNFEAYRSIIAAK